MPFLIDGHNLIGQMPEIGLENPNDEAELVQKLSGFAARTGKRCVVVFDTGLPGGKSRMSTHKVEVVFASNRTNADKVILERIRKMRDASNWTVVSSDHAVLSAAKNRGMKTVSSADFSRGLRHEATPPDGDKPSDIRLSPEEVEAWLRLFSDEK